MVFRWHSQLFHTCLIDGLALVQHDAGLYGQAVVQRQIVDHAQVPVVKLVQLSVLVIQRIAVASFQFLNDGAVVDAVAAAPRHLSVGIALPVGVVKTKGQVEVKLTLLEVIAEAGVHAQRHIVAEVVACTQLEAVAEAFALAIAEILRVDDGRQAHVAILVAGFEAADEALAQLLPRNVAQVVVLARLGLLYQRVGGQRVD